MPTRRFIFVPTRELWPAASVDVRVPPVPIAGLDDKRSPRGLPASAWLSRNRHVEQMTWAPGDEALIGGRLIADRGWIERAGVNVFNLYRPPSFVHGYPAEAGPWLDHIRKVYPDDADHIIKWFAHRVQRPGEKINHALVLGGAPGIGKDTILEPVRRAVGPWNFADVSPKQAMGRFNKFLRSVVLRINEGRDLGEFDRYAFYEHTKSYIAAPTDALYVDEKNLGEYYLPNVCEVVITTNHKTDGIYLPPDDRRHYVAWSDCANPRSPHSQSAEEDGKAAFSESYFNDIWKFYRGGGDRHVSAYLARRDLSDWDPKAPPRGLGACAGEESGPSAQLLACFGPPSCYGRSGKHPCHRAPLGDHAPACGGGSLRQIILQ